MTLQTARLILASGSPRRRDLLGRLGVDFEVLASGVAEDLQGLPPKTLARRLALDKAEAVSAIRADALVLGADTVIDLEGRELGKPADEGDARRILLSLRNRWHAVVTGLALIEGAAGRRRVSAVLTRVRMRNYSEAEIAAYIRSGEPMDKAGAYAIQGLGGELVEAVDGCHFNVVGLPLCETARLLRRARLHVPPDPPICRTADGQPCPRW